MSPRLRQAAHRALDIILDAIAEEQAVARPKKRTRGPAAPAKLVAPSLPAARLAELEEQAERQLRRAGYKART